MAPHIRAAAPASPEDILEEHTPEVITITQWLRGLVFKALPEAREQVYVGWHGFGYHVPGAGYVCAVFPRAHEVRLSFEHGAELPDPHRLLEGRGRQVRYVPVSRPGDPDEEVLVELLHLASERASGWR